MVGQTSTVHDLILQKSIGVFELEMWGEQVAGASDITISLGSARAKVTIYDTTVGVTPIQVQREQLKISCLAIHMTATRSVGLRIPVMTTMRSGAWRPLDPVDDDQGGA